MKPSGIFRAKIVVNFRDLHAKGGGEKEATRSLVNGRNGLSCRSAFQHVGATFQKSPCVRARRARGRYQYLRPSVPTIVEDGFTGLNEVNCDFSHFPHF